MDARRLYMGQLLRKYKINEPESFCPKVYSVNYRFIGQRLDSFLYFRHNEGIDIAIGYIRELENKIDELQYIERIIKLAKAEDRSSEIKELGE